MSSLILKKNLRDLAQLLKITAEVCKRVSNSPDSEDKPICDLQKQIVDFLIEQVLSKKLNQPLHLWIRKWAKEIEKDVLSELVQRKFKGKEIAVLLGINHSAFRAYLSRNRIKTKKVLSM